MILSSFALDAINWLEVIILIVGIVLIAVDLFLIPSFGILGISGIILFLIGLFGLLLPGLEYVSFEYDTQVWKNLLFKNSVRTMKFVNTFLNKFLHTGLFSSQSSH